MRLAPREFTIGDIYLPPLLVDALLGLILAWLTSRALNRYRLSRLFFYPPLVFLALAVIYTVFLSTFVIPS